MLDLRPSSDNPSKFDLLVCDLLKSDKIDFLTISADEINFFPCDSWNLILSKDGKWRIE